MTQTPNTRSNAESSSLDSLWTSAITTKSTTNPVSNVITKAVEVSPDGVFKDTDQITLVLSKHMIVGVICTLLVPLILLAFTVALKRKAKKLRRRHLQRKSSKVQVEDPIYDEVAHHRMMSSSLGVLPYAISPLLPPRRPQFRTLPMDAHDSFQQYHTLPSSIKCSPESHERAIEGNTDGTIDTRRSIPYNKLEDECRLSEQYDTIGLTKHHCGKMSYIEESDDGYIMPSLNQTDNMTLTMRRDSESEVTTSDSEVTGRMNQIMLLASNIEQSTVKSHKMMIDYINMNAQDELDTSDYVLPDVVQHSEKLHTSGVNNSSTNTIINKKQVEKKRSMTIASEIYPIQTPKIKRHTESTRNLELTTFGKTVTSNSIKENE